MSGAGAVPSTRQDRARTQAEITRRLSSKMISANKAGSFLFVGSGSARVLRTNGLAYCASKRSLEWLMKSIALELGPHGIRVNMIEPGFWVGSALASHPPDYIAATVAQILLRRLPGAEDAASVAVFLPSEAANYITGISVPADGRRVNPAPARYQDCWYRHTAKGDGFPYRTYSG